MEQEQTLRRRIDSTRDMQSVVRTMKSLAVVNMRQFQKAVQSIRDFVRTVEMGLQVVLMHHREILGSAGGGAGARGAAVAGGGAGARGATSPLGAVVFGSAHGMCGQFNQQIVGFAAREIARVRTADQPLLIMALGGRAAGPLEREGLKAERIFPISGSLLDITRILQELLFEIERWRFERGVDRIVLLYNRTQSRSTYEATLVNLLPVFPLRLRHIAERPWESRCIPIQGIDPERMFRLLIRQLLFSALYTAFVESMASENAARMSSMQAAEQNIEDRLDDLQTRYNRLRQASITNELLDIVAGFEALTGK